MIRRPKAIADIPRPAPPQAVPGWALPDGTSINCADAAFLAGAALNSLDSVVRGDFIFAGAWRQRLALKCTTVACRLAGRGEDEAALRDAWTLRPAGEALGPAGSLLAAWRLLTRQGSVLEPATVLSVAELLGLPRDQALDEIAAMVAPPLDAETDRPGPFAAASTVARVLALRPDAELLAWWLADWALARKMRWRHPVPLFMAQAFSPALRAGGRGQGRQSRLPRIASTEAAEFDRALCLCLIAGAADACRLAGELARRSDRLLEVVPKLRAKGAPDAIRLLLEDDAVPGTFATKNLSRFASRRLFERLRGFGAVRELSGRSTFRIYGL